jgi:hypothetical protein
MTSDRAVPGFESKGVRAGLRRSHVVVVVHGQIRQYRSLEGAVHVSLPSWYLYIHWMANQVCLLSRKEDDRNEDGEE